MSAADVVCRHGLAGCAPCAVPDRSAVRLRWDEAPTPERRGLPDATVARRLLVGTADGSPVRGYRSRKGHTWPGFRPIVPAVHAAHVDDVARDGRAIVAALVPAGSYPIPATLRDVRSATDLDVAGAAAARAIVRAAHYLRPAQRAALLAHVEGVTRTRQ